MSEETFFQAVYARNGYGPAHIADAVHGLTPAQRKGLTTAIVNLMRAARHVHEQTMREQDSVNRLCGEMPDGWTASIDVYGGSDGVSCQLSNPDGDTVDHGSSHNDGGFLGEVQAMIDISNGVKHE